MIDGWPAALTIAGSDSWGGAGLEADLRTFAAFGVWGTVAVTAVTAQNHRGVHSASLMAPEMVIAQIEAVSAAMKIGAVKTGMLGDAAVIDAVAKALDAYDLGPLVVDPVQGASQGGRLLDPGAIPALVSELLPRAALVTPNLPEAEALLGRAIPGRAHMAEAAAALASLGPGAVLLKGGHLEGEESPDLLYHNGEITWLEGPRLSARHTHGTGCTLSAAIAAQLAAGTEIREACLKAKRYVTDCIGALLPQE